MKERKYFGIINKKQKAVAFYKEGSFSIMAMGNVIVGQSGGPTSVINSSLAGVFKTARDRGAKKIYGMRNGIQRQNSR